MSMGADINRPSDFFSYIDYQLTFGPEKENGSPETHLTDVVYRMPEGRGRQTLSGFLPGLPGDREICAGRHLKGGNEDARQL